MVGNVNSIRATFMKVKTNVFIYGREENTVKFFAVDFFFFFLTYKGNFSRKKSLLSGIIKNNHWLKDLVYPMSSQNYFLSSRANC